MAATAIDIQKLYVAYFGRPADPAGLDYWTGMLGGDVVTLGDVSRSFAAAQEYRDSYSHMDSRTVITKVYDHLFGREAEAGGIAYWADLMDRGVISIDDAVKAISDAAVGTDRIAFDGKVAAATIFTLRLDAPNEVAAYDGEAALEIAMAFLDTVKDVGSAVNAVDPVVVDAWIARIVGADGTGIDDVGLVGVAPLV
jgi:hypothetical protein